MLYPPFFLVSAKSLRSARSRQGAKRRSGPLTARTDLGSSKGEGKGDTRPPRSDLSDSKPSRRDKYRR